MNGYNVTCFPITQLRRFSLLIYKIRAVLDVMSLNCHAKWFCHQLPKNWETIRWKMYFSSKTLRVIDYVSSIFVNYDSFIIIISLENLKDWWYNFIFLFFDWYIAKTNNDTTNSIYNHNVLTCILIYKNLYFFELRFRYLLPIHCLSSVNSNNAVSSISGGRCLLWISTSVCCASVTVMTT